MLVRRIYEWAHAAPGKTALVYCGIPFSYRDFALRIESARQGLGRQPMRAGGIAAVVAENTFDQWILVLALRSMGMTTVALRSFDKIDALGLDVAALVLATAQSPAKSLGRRSPDFVWIRIRPGIYFGDEIGELPNPERVETVPGAHIMLTSGTTGIYKKVLTDDAIEAVRFPFNTNLCGFNARSLVCMFNMGAWTAAYIQAGAIWHVGGAVLFEEGPHLHRPFQRPDLTDTVCSPPMLEQLMALPRETFTRNDNLSICYGSAAMSWPLAERILTRLTPNLFNHIGSTEVGAWGRTPIREPDDLKSHCLVREVQIVDEDDRVLPPGEIGRLRVRNENGITRYLNDEEATRGAFRDGYFYPGDLSFLQSDGHLVMQGRATDVINLRGDKVTPEPLERALRARLGIDEVCVISLPATGAAEELHVAIESPRPIGEDVLTNAWRSTVPDGPLPRFHLVAALPRNEAGKVQRQVLRERVRTGAL
jgi:acyl-coenzyme A synthetase/AMP-(fatty) acid ligase